MTEFYYFSHLMVLALFILYIFESPVRSILMRGFRSPVLEFGSNLLKIQSSLVHSPLGQSRCEAPFSKA